MGRKARWRAAAVAGAALALVYVAVPQRTVVEAAWLALAAGSSAAVVAGARLHRPAVRRPWQLLAFALGMLTVANLVIFPPWDQQASLRAVSQAVELLAFPLFGVASLWLVRAQAPQGDREGAIDGAIVAVALATVLSSTVFTPEAVRSNTVFGWALLVVAPITLAWVTTTSVRLLFLGHRHVTSTRLLVAAAACALVGHVLRGVLYAEGAYGRGDWQDLFVAGAYVCIGLSALHPSMRRLTEPVDAVDEHPSHARLAVLGAALVTVPALLLLQHRGAPLPLAASIVVALLTLWRLARLVQDREQARDIMRHRSVHDELTGLPNRAGLLEHLDAAAGASARDGSTAVLFIDLDGFKQVNDVHGHAAGDELLVAVAGRVNGLRRSGDLLARLAGDEFVLVCHDMDEPTAGLVAQRVVDALSRPFVLRGDTVVVSASVGIAVSEAGRNAEQLLAHADAAMYAVKRRGGGAQERFGAALGESLRRRRRLEADIGLALARDEMRLVYQPVVALRDDPRGGGPPVVGVEALLRWTHRSLGAVPPDEFIAVADRSGGIGQLGEWVLRQVCEQLRRWDDEHDCRHGGGHHPLTAFVNLSARQLLDPRLPARVHAALRAAGVDAQRLVLEVTETAVLDGGADGAGDRGGDAIRTLHELQRAGLRIALDDFGTGFSSLTHLRRLPVDIIKIDASFVRHVVASAADRAIVEAVVHIAAHRGAQVIAEGVETPDELEVVAELGCGFAQGYLLGRPAPPDALALRGQRRHRGPVLASRTSATAPASPQEGPCPCPPTRSATSPDWLVWP